MKLKTITLLIFLCSTCFSSNYWTIERGNYVWAVVKTADNQIALTYSDEDSLYLEKVTSDGIRLWVHSYDYVMWGFDLIETSDKGFILSNSGRIIKTDSLGTPLWEINTTSWGIVEIDDSSFYMWNRAGVYNLSIDGDTTLILPSGDIRCISLAPENGFYAVIDTTYFGYTRKIRRYDASGAFYLWSYELESSWDWKYPCTSTPDSGMVVSARGLFKFTRFGPDPSFDPDYGSSAINYRTSAIDICHYDGGYAVVGSTRVVFAGAYTVTDSGRYNWYRHYGIPFYHYWSGAAFYTVYPGFNGGLLIGGSIPSISGSYGVLISTDSLGYFMRNETGSEPGWNLVSYIYNETVSPANLAFPGLIEPSVWQWDGDAYSAADSVYAGYGYFTLCESEIDSFIGIPCEGWALNLDRGWNLIGSLVDTMSVSSVIVAPATAFIPPLWGWNGVNYYEADEILPGKGYWILLTSPARVELIRR